MSNETLFDAGLKIVVDEEKVKLFQHTICSNLGALTIFEDIDPSKNK